MTEIMKLCAVKGEQVRSQIEDLMKAEGNLTLTMKTLPGEVHLQISSKGEDKETRKERKSSDTGTEAALWSQHLYYRAG